MSEANNQPAKPRADTPPAPLHGQSVEVQTFEISAGPLPAPEVLSAYDRLLPGASARIFSMAEADQVHRHKQEDQAIQANIHAQNRQLDIAERQVTAVQFSDAIGQTLGAIISAAAIAGAVYLGMQGHTEVAVALVALPLAGIIRALRQRSRDESTEAK
jgi:uncharacterized membrane protein